MAPQTLPPAQGSSRSPAAPLMIELYTFDTLLLTFQGRKVATVALPPVPVQPTTTNPQDTSNSVSDTNADAVTQVDQKTTPSFSVSIPLPPPPASPNLIVGETHSTPLLKEAVSPPPSTSAILGVSSDSINSADTYPNLPSWIELLSSPLPPPPLTPSLSGSSSPSESGRYSSNTNSGSNDIVGGKPARVKGIVTETAAPGEPGGPGEGRGGEKVRGGITLAYQACQMLPEPIHLRHVNTTSLLPPPTTAIVAPTTTATNGTGIRNGSGSESNDSYAYAIEYFADQGCTQFVMATAGTRVNVWQAELDLVERNSEEERRDDSNKSGGGVTARNRDDNSNISSIMQIARRQSSQPPLTAAAAGVSPPSPADTYTPWTPPPTRKKDLKRLDTVVSVRWVGILKPTEFTISKAMTTSRQLLNPNRLHFDPLLERRGNGGEDDNFGNDGGADEDEDDGSDSDNTDTPSSEESGKGATGDKTSTPPILPTPTLTPIPTPPLTPPLQDGKDADSVGGVVGFVSWIPFNETTQLQQPNRRDVGSIPFDEMVFNRAHREAISSINGTRNSTATAAANASPTGHTGIAHMTSQILMAGLIAGLLLILGSLLTAVYYRQQRKKWYEENGEV